MNTIRCTGLTGKSVSMILRRVSLRGIRYSPGSAMARELSHQFCAAHCHTVRVGPDVAQQLYCTIEIGDRAVHAVPLMSLAKNFPLLAGPTGIC